MLIVKNDVFITVEDINTFAEKLGIDLPEKYKFFLLKYNGGRTIKTKFKNSVNVRLLYPLKSENGYDLLTIINYENTEKIIDLGFFPIGETEFGDYICIRIQDDNSIWLIMHDKYEKNKK